MNLCIQKSLVGEVLPLQQALVRRVDATIDDCSGVLHWYLFFK
jgi:hypothetical protein